MAGPRFEPLPAKPLSAASNRPCYHFGRARPAGGTANAPRGGRAGRTGARAPPKPRRACGREERRPSYDGRAGNPAGRSRPPNRPKGANRTGSARKCPERKDGRTQDASLGRYRAGTPREPAGKALNLARAEAQPRRPARKSEAFLRSNSREVCTAKSVSAKSLVDALSTLAFPSYIRDSWIRTQVCTVFSQGVSHNGRAGRGDSPGAGRLAAETQAGPARRHCVAPAPLHAAASPCRRQRHRRPSGASPIRRAPPSRHLAPTPRYFVTPT